MKQPILRTERLILRAPKISDWKDIVEGLKDEETVKYMSVGHPYKKKDAYSWLNMELKVQKMKERESYHFLIELKSEKKVIGCISLGGIKKIDRLAKTGSWINREYQKRGYMTEAKIAANEFAFNKLKLRKLTSPVITVNTASNATQKRMGYKIEGVLRKELVGRVDKKIYDENLYGLMKEDWKKNLPKLKKHLKNKIKKLDKKENKK